MITEKAKRIATRSGFVEEFWRDLAESRRIGYTLTQEDIFKDLNALYSRSFGQSAFSSFDAFRKYRDRHR